MLYDLLNLVFLFSLATIAVYLGKKLLQPDFDKNEEQISNTAPSKKADPEADQYQVDQSINQPARKPKFSFSLILILAISYLLISNQELLKEKFASSSAVKETGKIEKQTISSANVCGHQIVDGVNWIKIVATSSKGIPFEGWVSEMAIQKEPPKENKTADAFMEKLGLPTNRERIESIKSLKKVGTALKDTLKNSRDNNP